MFDEKRMSDLEIFIKKHLSLKTQKPMLFIISEEHNIDAQKVAEMRVIELLVAESNAKKNKLKLFLELDNFRNKGSKLADFYFFSKTPTWTSMEKYVSYHGGNVACIDTALELKVIKTLLCIIALFAVSLAICNFAIRHIALKYLPAYTMLFIPIILAAPIIGNYQYLMAKLLGQFKFLYDEEGMQFRNEEMLKNLINSSELDYGIAIFGAAHTPFMLKNLYASQKFDIVHLIFSKKFIPEALNSPYDLPDVPEFHLEKQEIIITIPPDLLLLLKENKLPRYKGK